MQYIFNLEQVSKFYDKKQILKDITLAFLPGAKIGVIGANGAGKSTLLKIIAGEDKEYDGVARPAEGITIGYVAQEPHLDPAKTVRENVRDGMAAIQALLTRYDKINERLGEPMSPEAMEKLLEEQAKVQEQIEHKKGWEIDRFIDLAMHALGVPDGDLAVTHLSGGEKRRIALCRTLMSQPDLLLLDEPTNHLDADSVAWLERHLAEYEGTVILITHDRYFLDNVVGWMLEIDRGNGIPYEGNYSAYLEQRQVRMGIAQRQESARQKMLARELEWIRMSPRARVAKSKARIANYEKLLAQEVNTVDDSIELQIPPGPRLGNRVAEGKGIRKGFGDRVLINGLDFTLPPGGIVGVIGPNGVGKTTFAKMLTGQEKPDAGEIKLGEKTVICYVDQSRDSLDGKKTVYEEISGGIDQIPFGNGHIASRAYLARFNFRGTDQQKLVKDLSGGERNRVQLAKLLRRGSNLIILDEPTNDLDLDTLRVLEEAIQSFGGSMVIITHDRYFLDRVATHILAFEGDGKVVWHEGNYQEYQERRERERKEQGQGPDGGRTKHRKLAT